MHRLKYFAKHFLSQIPIVLVILDLHFDVVHGVDKGEAQKHLSRGNQLLNAGQLAEALTHYHAAIDKDEHNYQAYYMRATVYLAMGKSRSALPDLNQVVKLQPSFVQARLQRGNLFLKMGKFDDAQADYEAVLSHEHNEEAALKVEEIRPLRRNVNHCHELIKANDFTGAIELLTVIIESCPWNAEFREMRAGAYERVGDLRKAVSDWKPTTVLKLDNTAAYLRMSFLWYQMGEVEESLEEVRECLKLDPDHKECYAHYKNVKKLFKTLEAGKSKMSESQWEEAISKYQKALKQESRIRPLLVEIKLKICECYVKANKPKEGLIAANEVLALESNNIPALIFRSELQTQNQEYEQALEDLQNAAKIDENYPGLKEKIKKAQKLLKQSQKRDYYKILGVPRNAQKKDIIKAYRKLAREWHPDNFQDESEKEVAEKRFIEIAAAKEVLTDPEKRQIFEDGYDPNDNEDMKEWEREQALERTRNVFKFFFQHRANERETPMNDDVLQDRFFRSFSRTPSQKATDENDFEEQLKEFQGRNFDYLKNFVDQKNQKQQQQTKRSFQHQHSRDDTHFRQDNVQKQEFSFYHHQHGHKSFGSDGQSQHEETKTFESRHFQENTDPRSSHSASHQHQRHGAKPEHDTSRTQQKVYSRDGFQSKQQQNQNQHWGRDDPRKPRTNGEQKEARGEAKRTQPPLKKKAKSNPQFRKKSTDDEMIKRFTKGTDGKWYYKGDDGRWRVHDGPPSFEQRSKKKTTHSKKSENSAQQLHQKEEPSDANKEQNKEEKREKETVYYKDKDGHWYVKVDFPFEGKTSSRQETSQSSKDHWQYQQHSHWRKKQEQRAYPTASMYHQAQSKSDHANIHYYHDASGVHQKDRESKHGHTTGTNHGEPHHQSSTGHEKSGPFYKQGSLNNRGQQPGDRFYRDQHQYQRGFDYRDAHLHQSGTNPYQSGTNRGEGGPRSQEKSAESRNTPGYNERTQKAPKSLFRNNRGEIVDKSGNIYERLPDGQIRLKTPAANAKQQAYHQQQRANQQQEQTKDPDKQQQTTKKIFRDGSGNVYVKDKNGNLIKVNPKRDKPDHLYQNKRAADQQSSNARHGSSFHQEFATKYQPNRGESSDRNQQKYDNSKKYYRPAHEEL